MDKFILENIKKDFNGNTIFENVNLVGEKGKSIAIKGKSGVGKSTLLNIIAGLERPSSGNYLLNNINMSTSTFNDLTKIRSKEIGYISQYSPMIPKLSAFENICVPLWFKKDNNTSNNLSIKRINQLSELFEVQPLLTKKIEMLSGGEIQRVGIIRSLINNPNLLVADEPTGALDDDTTLKVLRCFENLKFEGLTIIIATHSSLVAEHCDQVFTLSKDGLL